MVMSVEEEFQIEIPNEITETFVDPKSLIDYVASQVRGELTREQVAEKIWEILIDVIGIEREKFDENSRFIEDMGIS